MTGKLDAANLQRLSFLPEPVTQDSSGQLDRERRGKCLDRVIDDAAHARGPECHLLRSVKKDTARTT